MVVLPVIFVLRMEMELSVQLQASPNVLLRQTVKTHGPLEGVMVPSFLNTYYH